MDNVPGRLEMFLAPFSSMLQLLQQQDFNTGNVAVYQKRDFFVASAGEVV